MISSITQASSLVDVLQIHAAATPEKIAFGFLTDGDELDVKITFGELERHARAFAAALQQLAAPGDRALLLYPSGLAFIVAFLGCFYAGVIAIPTTIPHLKRATPRLKLMLEDASAKVACTTPELLERIKSAVDGYPEFQKLRWLVNEKYKPGQETAYQPQDVRAGDVAFLQYTSGSTSAPKGVMISHWNLLRTIHDIQSGIGTHSDSVTATWLPMFHDMGLIAALLSPVYTGSSSYIISPVAFLEKPARWLKLISRFKATHTFAPNFAYDLCVRKTTEAEKSALDLRSLKVAVDAAEPIRQETLLAFGHSFKSCGFDPEAFAPAYGLAESTVMVTVKLRGQKTAFCSIDPERLKENKLIFVPDDDPKGYKSVGCGWSAIGADIRIVDPATSRECPSDEIGEIWIQSDSVAQGYLDKPEENKITFQARLTGTHAGPYLRTGDMGFVKDGQLHITGRIKDMIILQGRNFYPQDIELGVEKCHAALRPHCGAAFALEDDHTERLVMVQELNREFRKSESLPEISNLVRQTIAKNHGLRAHAVVLIMPSTIPKTTSGKIQRSAARDLYITGQLDVLYEWRAPGAFGHIELQGLEVKR